MEDADKEGFQLFVLKAVERLMAFLAEETRLEALLLPMVTQTELEPLEGAIEAAQSIDTKYAKTRARRRAAQEAAGKGTTPRSKCRMPPGRRRRKRERNRAFKLHVTRVVHVQCRGRGKSSNDTRSAPLIATQ